MRDDPSTAANRDKEQRKVTIPPRRKPTAKAACLHPSRQSRDRSGPGKNLHPIYQSRERSSTQGNDQMIERARERLSSELREDFAATP